MFYEVNMENIIIRGFKQCWHCGEYAPPSDFTLDDRECHWCIRDQQEEDERKRQGKYPAGRFSKDDKKRLK